MARKKKEEVVKVPATRTGLKTNLPKIAEVVDVAAKYKDLVNSDLIEPILPLLRSGAYFFTKCGHIDCKRSVSPDTPWVHVRQAQGKDCGLWHQVWFNHYGFVPFGCQTCWKVVVRPRTLKETFELYEVMLRLDRPSKIGIERRFSVPALYGAYFYNNTYEDGQQCYKIVRQAVDDAMDPDIAVLLKRGCTEMEHAIGDSSKWTLTNEQAILEQRLSDLFLSMNEHFDQPEISKKHVMANWIKFAFAGGDPTAKLFSSQPLYPPYVTYHDHDPFKEQENGDHGRADS